MRGIKNISRKISIMLLGIFFSSLGVSFSMKSQLGATPIGVCPAVFSPALKIFTGLGMGILLGLFFVFQIIILKKKFHPFQLLQLAVTVIYSYFVDLTTNMLSSLPDGAVWLQVIYCALGINILAIGIFIMVKTNFLMLPQDAVVNVICKKYQKKYGIIKIALDIVLTAIGAIGSWVLYQKFMQVGIGTIAGAIFVGRTIGGLKEFAGLNHLLERAIGEI